MENFKYTILENGLHIQGVANNLMGETYPVSLLLSLKQTSLPWVKAGEWAKERGGELPSRAQWQAIQAHRNEINEVLEAAGKPILSGWYWTGEEYANNPRYAWNVNMYRASTDYYDKANFDYVRAVSAFQS